MPPSVGDRFTTRFTAEMHAQIVAWGHARGLSVHSEIIRALAVEGLERAKPVEARAFRAAYEQALAELRHGAREALVRAADEIRQGITRMRPR